jgi:lysophospholipase L1-like esterase
VLWRVERGELDGAISPRLRAVVVVVGVNNLVFGEDAPPAVAAKMLGVARAVEARTPDTVSVFLAALTPVDSPKGPVTPAMAQACNDALARECRDAGLRRTTILSFEKALARAGTRPPEPLDALSPDRLHLNERGYAALATALVHGIQKAL